MESSAARQRGEREAPENTKSVGLHRAQELLELLAGVVVDRRPPARATEFHPSSRRQSRRRREMRAGSSTPSLDCVRLYPMPQPWMASATVG